MTEVAPLVPTESMGDGNTSSSPTSKKRISACIRWCFTFNNYDSDDIEQLLINLKSICKKFVFQKEIGQSGTPHLQGAIWLKKKSRPSSFNLSDKIHWEIMRNEEASIAYCSKSDTSIGEPYLFGFPKPLKIISDLYPWQQSIEDIYFTEPDGRTCNWFWENTGGVGKSAFCKYMVVKHGALVIQGGKLGDIMNMIFNTDMEQCSMVIVDVPRTNGNLISYASIECILNGMITNTKYETGTKVFNPPHVVIFCNFPPENSKLSSDRWRVIEIA